MDVPANDDRMLIVYDGQCPFCTSYVRMNRLKEAAGKVELIDARSQDPATQFVRAAGYDLNEGMAVIWANRIYYGKDAVVLISSIADSNSRWAARLMALLLGSRRSAAFFYPIMKFGRRVTLALLGRPPIS